MRIVSDEAEESLIRILEERSSSLNMGCCLQIKGGLFDDSDFQMLPKWITGWVGDSHSEIFVCHDRDIFVFSPYMSHDSYLQFKSIFQERFSLQKAMHCVSFHSLEDAGPILLEAVTAKLAKRRKEFSRKEAEDALAVKKHSLERLNQIKTSVEHTIALKKRRKSRSAVQVLVVEDDHFSRTLISAAIGNQYAVAFAEDAYSALVTYLNTAPDIVFLDINLPDASGLDILIRVLSFDPDAYPVMLSGNSSTDNIKHAVMLGAKGFVGKPFSKEKLIQYIQKSRPQTTQKAMV